MPAVRFPPEPSRLQFVRTGTGALLVEPVVDHPAAYHLAARDRSPVSSEFVARCCVEQLLFEALPAFDDRSREASVRLARSAALSLLPAVLYRLRVEGFRFGRPEVGAARVALVLIRDSGLSLSEVVARVACRSPSQWSKVLRSLNTV